MSFFINKVWYGNHPLKWLLFPFALCYRAVVFARRRYIQRFGQWRCPVPLIVVGNLTVGGVGKTPLVIELAKKMQARGLKVGIVSRGYGARITHFPYEIRLDDLASEVGDEPLMIARKTLCPLVISPKRTEAVDYLLEKHQVQVIISDDGLQHYRMARAIEIVVIDGLRGLGNKLCLPAGPLREPAARLKEVDFIVVNEGHWDNAHSMKLVPGNLINLSTQEEIAPELLKGEVAAVAAIGNPQRFYSTLRDLGIKFNTYSYPDHYQFKANDLNYSETSVIMTEKDAVKCHSFNSDRMYYLPVEATLSECFWETLWSHQQLQGYC